MRRGNNYSGARFPYSRRRKPRDMSGTARCLDCDARAEHERGPGTPLVIRHKAGCPSDPTQRKEETE